MWRHETSLMLKRSPWLAFSAVLALIAALSLGAGILKSQSAASSSPAADQGKDPVPPAGALMKFHAAHVQAFAASQGFGIARVGRPPMWKEELMAVTLPAPESGTVTYRREQFTLIGLLLEASPVVYKETPNAEALGLRSADLPHFAAKTGAHSTQPPDAFENESLIRLRGGEELVVQSAKDGSLRMVGAVRAQTQCISCHESEREGALLGAFAYRLQPAPRPVKVGLADPPAGSVR